MASSDPRPGPPSGTPPSPERPRFDIAGICVLILTVAVAVSVVVSFAGLVWHSEHLTPEGAALTDTAAGAALGIIASYVGAKVWGRRD